MSEDDKIRQQITRLEEEHRSLDKMISNSDGGGMDQLRIQRLKKRKLWLKDEIAKLQSILCPDIIA